MSQYNVKMSAGYYVIKDQKLFSNYDPSDLLVPDTTRIPQGNSSKYSTALPFAATGPTEDLLDHVKPYDCIYKNQELNKQQVIHEISKLPIPKCTAKFVKEKVVIYCIKRDNNDINNHILKELLNFLVYPSYMPINESNHTNKKMVIGMFLSFMLSVHVNLLEQDIIDALARYGYSPEFKKCTLAECHRNIDEHYPDFKSITSSKSHEFAVYDDGMDIKIIICIASFLCLTKVINKDGYIKYIENRYRAFSATAGRPNLLEALKRFTPRLETASNIHSSMTSTHGIRRQIFLGMLSLANQPLDGNNLTVLTKKATELMAFSEMTHIVAIDNICFNMFREVLACPSLRSEVENMRSIYSYLKTLEPGMRPYAKILKPEKRIV